MKKKTVLLIGIILSLIIIHNYNISNVNIIKSEKITSNQNQSISMLYETEAASGAYIASTDNGWPNSDKLIFNEKKSSCKNGSKLTYNQNENKVYVEANTEDKCYVYFDRITLTKYIKNLFTNNGVNDLYYHDTNLANSAEDNSLRYSGASPSNYVCFASDDEKCDVDNLYRIIGVFDINVKLIKSDYATKEQIGTTKDCITGNHGYDKTYYKGDLAINSLAVCRFNYYNNKTVNDGKGSTDWNTSALNKDNLNTNYITYLNNINPKWTKMIEEHYWNVGPYGSSSDIPKNFYENEKKVQTIEMSKIAIMNASDYGFAASQSAWSKSLNSYVDVADTNWMYMGLIEWTITPRANENFIFNWLWTGGYNSSNPNNDYAVRPVFYLTENVTVYSGTGTKSNPYRLSK